MQLKQQKSYKGIFTLPFLLNNKKYEIKKCVKNCLSAKNNTNQNYREKNWGPTCKFLHCLVIN